MSLMMSGPAAGGLPQGELLATYSTYAQAREQVDRLAAADFPVSAVSIVGKDLRLVERVRGRLDYGQVALSAAVRGLLFGAMIGTFLLLLDPTGGVVQIGTSALIGLAVWVIFAVIGFAARKGAHGFSSSQGFVPGGYDLVVAFEHAARARQELGLGARRPAVPTPTTAPAQAPAGGTAPDAAPADPAVPPAPTGGSHAAGAVPTGAAPARDPEAADPARSDGSDVPTGLDRRYGVTLPPEEVQRLIEARGGHPAPADEENPRG